jgi:hypothetical protein
LSCVSEFETAGDHICLSRSKSREPEPLSSSYGRDFQDITRNSFQDHTTASQHTFEHNIYGILLQWNIVGNDAANDDENLMETHEETAAIFAIVADSTTEVACLVKGIGAGAPQQEQGCSMVRRDLHRDICDGKVWIKDHELRVVASYVTVPSLPLIERSEAAALTAKCRQESYYTTLTRSFI